jgi:hypothetical protein
MLEVTVWPTCLVCSVCVQVFKGGLSRTGMEEGEQLRYFAAQASFLSGCVLKLETLPTFPHCWTCLQGGAALRAQTKHTMLC